MNKNWLIFLAVILISIATVLTVARKYGLVEINGHKFFSKLALSRLEREKGLAGQKRLCRNCSMLFLFNGEGRYPFWMKGMNYDLDIIWINGDKIIQIAKNISRESLEILEPETEADKVLEINAGLSDDYGLNVGSPVHTFILYR